MKLKVSERKFYKSKVGIKILGQFFLSHRTERLRRETRGVFESLHVFLF